jgi:hypothetical protein
MNVLYRAMKRWFVGNVRLNDQVTSTALVKSLRQKYNSSENFDFLEIFNAAVPNDPSPPSKAIAVLNRSTVNGTPCATTVFQKVLDYNNRDFYAWETQRLVDTIARQWLEANGGGVQLTVHRPILEGSNIFHRLIRHVRKTQFDPKTVDIFTCTKETNDHRYVMNVFEKRFFTFPFGARTALPEPSTDSVDCTVIPGLSDTPIARYTLSSSTVNVLHVDRLASVVHAQCLQSGGPTDELPDLMKSIMKEHNCMEGVVYTDTPLPGPNTYHSFSVLQRTIGVEGLTAHPLALGKALLV